VHQQTVLPISRWAPERKPKQPRCSTEVHGPRHAFVHMPKARALPELVPAAHRTFCSSRISGPRYDIGQRELLALLRVIVVFGA